MKLTYLGKDPESGEDGCPTLYETDRDTLIVQGGRVTDPEALAELRRRGLPEHETAVEIPLRLLQHAPKVTPPAEGEQEKEG